MTPITLSAANGKATFDDVLAQETVTLLLIFGNDAAASIGQTFCQGLENDSPDDFASVQFIFVPDYNLILNSLQALTLSFPPDLSKPFVWADYSDTSCMSISPGNNLVSFIINNATLLNSPGQIRAAIICALDNE